MWMNALFVRCAGSQHGTIKGTVVSQEERLGSRCDIHIVFDVTLNGFIKLTAAVASMQTQT